MHVHMHVQVHVQVVSEGVVTHSGDDGLPACNGMRWLLSLYVYTNTTHSP
jgi:hypothetical protein